MESALIFLVILPYFIDLVLSFLLVYLMAKAFKTKAGVKNCFLISFAVSVALIIPFVLLYAGIQVYLPYMTWISYAAAAFVVLFTFYSFLGSNKYKSVLSSLLYISLYLLAMAAIVKTVDNALTDANHGSKNDNSFYLTNSAMAHNGSSWKNWFISQGIQESRIDAFPFQNGISQGSVVNIQPAGNVVLGDVILYQKDPSNVGYNVLARVVGIVEVKDWKIGRIDGSIDCLKESDYAETFIPWARNQSLTDSSFNFYMTKADDKNVTRQCSDGIAPVLDSRIIGKAV